MAGPLELEPLDLAALVSSRICHDVISPVGAIVNGLEVLDEEKDPQMREFALELVKKSARQASARLQFARLAFGAAGSAGASIDLGDAETVARGAVADSKIELSWQAPRLLLPKNQVKLLLNLMLVAQSTIPRGGKIAVSVESDGGTQTRLRLVADGISARIPPNLAALLAGEAASVDAHAIQPFYTGLVARAAGLSVSLSVDGECVTIVAEPGTAAAEAPVETAADA
jgi:histidine phosphotransferase ChpT